MTTRRTHAAMAKRQRRKKNVKASSSAGEQETQTLSPLLNLPPELRNEIYSYCTHDADAKLHPRCRGKLLTTSPLSRVSRQVREEYMAVSYVSTSSIRALVKDVSQGGQRRKWVTGSDAVLVRLQPHCHVLQQALRARTRRFAVHEHQFVPPDAH